MALFRRHIEQRLGVLVARVYRRPGADQALHLLDAPGRHGFEQRVALRPGRGKTQGEQQKNDIAHSSAHSTDPSLGLDPDLTAAYTPPR